MPQYDNTTELIHHIEALRGRADALDVAAVGIAEGIRRNTVAPDAAWQLLDLISADFKAHAEALLQLLT